MGYLRSYQGRDKVQIVKIRDAFDVSSLSGSGPNGWITIMTESQSLTGPNALGILAKEATSAAGLVAWSAGEGEVPGFCARMDILSTRYLRSSVRDIKTCLTRILARSGVKARVLSSRPIGPIRKSPLPPPLVKRRAPPNLLTCRKVRVLVNSHSNLELTAGDTVMIANLVNNLTDRGNKIVLVSGYPVSSFRRNLTMPQYVQIVDEVGGAANQIGKINELGQGCDVVFIRNHFILAEAAQSPLLHKMVLYGLGVHAAGLGAMNNRFHQVITQSEQLKRTLVSAGVAEKKISILAPMSYKYDFSLPERKDNEVRLIYCGTLRDEENILEIIEEFKKIHKERPEVVLKIVYGKIHGNRDFTRKVNSLIKQGVGGITFKRDLSHRDACYEIAASDIGICWRKKGWGDDGEVSTKLKQYEAYELLISRENLRLPRGIVFYKYGLKLGRRRSSVVDYVPFRTSSDILDNVKNNSRKYDYFNIITKDIASKLIRINNIDLLYCVYTFYPNHSSGYTRRTGNVASYLERNGVGFAITVNPYSYNYTSIHKDGKYIVFPYLAEGKHLYLSNMFRILYHLYNYSTLIGASNHTIGNSVSRLSGYGNVKTIYEVRGLWYVTRYQRTAVYDYKQEEQEIDACNNNDHVFVLNNSLRKFLISKGVNKNKMFVLKNSVMTDNNNVNKELSNELDYEYFFGYFGSLADYENISELLFCINYLRTNSQMNLTGIIIGKGECENNIKNYIEKNSLPIKFINRFITKEEVSEYYERVKCVILPRRKNILTEIVGPLKFVEAYCNNKFIIANDLEPLYDYIPIEEVSLRNSNIYLYSTSFTLIEICKYLYNNEVSVERINQRYNSADNALRPLLHGPDDLQVTRKPNLLFLMYRPLYDDMKKNAGYFVLIKEFLKALNRTYNLIITHMGSADGEFFVCDNVYSIKDNNMNADYALLENIIKEHDASYFVTDSNILNTEYDLLIDIARISSIIKRNGMKSIFFERGLSFLVAEYKRPLHFRNNFDRICEKARCVYDEFDLLMTLCTSTADFITKYVKPQHSQILVLYNYSPPVRTFTEKQEESIRRTHNIRSDDIVISYLGNIVSYENLHVLLSTFKKHIQFFEKNNVKLMIVGSAPSGSNLLDALKEEYCCNDNIIFTGHIAADRIDLYHAITSVGVICRKDCMLTNHVMPTKIYKYIQYHDINIVPDYHVFREIKHQGDNLVLYKEHEFDRVLLDTINHRQSQGSPILPISKNNMDVLKSALSRINQISKPYFVLPGKNTCLYESDVCKIGKSENVVVMCLWKRKEKLREQLMNFSEQTFKDYTLVLIINNVNEISAFSNIVRCCCNKYKLSVRVYTNFENLGGINRYVVIHDLLQHYKHIKYAFTIDDDQLFENNNVLERVFGIKPNKEVHSYWYRALKKHVYCNIDRNGRDNIFKYKELIYDKVEHLGVVDYAASCGCLFNVEPFRTNEYFKNIKYRHTFIEDLVMSMFFQKKGYSLHYNKYIDLKTIKDGKNQSIGKLYLYKNELFEHHYRSKLLTAFQMHFDLDHFICPDHIVIHNTKINISGVIEPNMSHNINFRLHSFREILCVLAGSELYMLNTFINNYIEKCSDYEEFDLGKRNWQWNDHSMSWRVIVFCLLCDKLPYLLENSTIANIKKHCDLIYDGFLAGDKYANGNHGLYHDLAGMYYCKHFKHDNMLFFENRFIRNISRNVSFSEGLCLEHSTNYHRLYKSICDMYKHIQPDREEISGFISSFNSNFDYFMNDGKYLQFGDTDIEPLYEERNTIKDVAPSEDTIRLFPKSGFAFYKSDRFHLGVTNCFHSVNHKQKDDSSFVFYYKNNLILCDGGRYDYNKGTIRSGVTGFQAHNCLEIPDLGREYFNSKYGSGKFSTNNSNEIYVDNPLYNEGHVTHKRTFRINETEKSLAVIDSVSNLSDVRYTGILRYNFHPDIDIRKGSNLVDKYTIESKDDIDVQIVGSLYSPKTMKVYDNERIETTFEMQPKESMLITFRLYLN